MIADSEGRSLQIDGEGYLVDPDSWDEMAAEQLAATEQVVLGEEHWRVITFMRRYYDAHQVAADARFVIKFMAEEMGMGKKARNQLFKLFPYGYVQQACKIAGMKRPRGWSTG
jgi:tRNA 2-thiouridine synthesizing protein E